MTSIVILVLIAFIIGGPFLSIWAVNLLFGTAIPFTLATWFASLWLTGILVSGVSK